MEQLSAVRLSLKGWQLADAMFLRLVQIILYKGHGYATIIFNSASVDAKGERRQMISYPDFTAEDVVKHRQP